MKMVAETLASIPVERPQPSAAHAQNLCLDKGYAYEEVRELVAEFGFTAHIPPKGQAAHQTKRTARRKARRWVVERTHSWMNRFRGILIRWCKKPENYIALLHFALALITYRAAGLSG
jgi:putative transposase